MPRPKKNTHYRTSDEGIFPPILKRFQKKYGQFPSAWGNEEEQGVAALFLARIAADPECFERIEQGVTSYNRLTWKSSLGDYYAADPDSFLEFMTFVRTQLKVCRSKDCAKAYLREGAVQRFKEKEAREPTDDDLSAMLKEEYGISIGSEHFGDARRALVREDRESQDTLNQIGQFSPF